MAKRAAQRALAQRSAPTVVIARSRTRRRRCTGSTTTCRPATATRCGCCSPSSAFRSSSSSSTSPKGLTRTPEFLARNPNGRIPTLEIEPGVFLPESNAILFYLAEGTPFFPDRPARARPGAAVDVLRAVQPRAEHRHRALLAVARPAHARAPRAARPEARNSATPRSASWSSTWRGATFFVGERYSIADIALYAYTHVADEGGFDLAPVPGRRRLAGPRAVAAAPHPDHGDSRGAYGRHVAEFGTCVHVKTPDANGMPCPYM